MSEVAGRLAIQAAGDALRRDLGGMGLLLGGVPGVRPARVLVLGGGTVGTQAARMAVGLGADVTILDRAIARLRELDELFQSRVRTRYSTASAVKDEIADADVVVGAVLVPGGLAPKLVSRSMLELMRPGAVLVDVAIDQGGCFETSRATSHADPTFIVDGIIHYCVANMPGVVPVTSSKALTNATLPFIETLAAGRLAESPALLCGLNVHNGMITNRAVAESLGLPFVSPQNALAKGGSLKH
jgi:alanine dehydrogenase